MAWAAMPSELLRMVLVCSVRAWPRPTAWTPRPEHRVPSPKMVLLAMVEGRGAPALDRTVLVPARETPVVGLRNVAPEESAQAAGGRGGRERAARKGNAAVDDAKVGAGVLLEGAAADLSAGVGDEDAGDGWGRAGG